MSLSSTTQEVLWLCKFEDEFNLVSYSNSEPTTIFCDSMSAIDLAKSNGHHARTKHRHHFVRQHISEGRLNVQHIGTEQITANTLDLFYLIIYENHSHVI